MRYALNALISLATLAFLLFPQVTIAQAVKMSSAKICHDTSSPYYEHVKNFRAYTTIVSCLSDGGRLPKSSKPLSNTTTLPKPSSQYSRSAFAHWIDDDNDCLNTRHELLLQLSTGKVTMSHDGCRVMRGRWNDPYSGQIFFDTSKLDVDHLVPLAWAWQNGASGWTDEKRKQFANDPINLFAVSASLNRSKGAQGPDTWLPPNQNFHCQYITRYLRVLIEYDFPIEARDKIRSLKTQKCS